MVDEAKEIVIENAFCRRNEEERQLLSSWKSYDGSSSKQEGDMLKYATDLKTNRDDNIHRG
jgi:hypothetical protein